MLVYDIGRKEGKDWPANTRDKDSENILLVVCKLGFQFGFVEQMLNSTNQKIRGFLMFRFAASHFTRESVRTELQAGFGSDRAITRSLVLPGGAVGMPDQQSGAGLPALGSNDTRQDFSLSQSR
jgi:hypothetical protein